MVKEKPACKEGDLEVGEASDPEVEDSEGAEGHLEDHSGEIGVAVVLGETEDQEAVSVVEMDPDHKIEADSTAIMKMNQDLDLIEEGEEELQEVDNNLEKTFYIICFIFF